MTDPVEDSAMPTTTADVAPTALIDSDHPDILAFVRDTCAGTTGIHERVNTLFSAIRDEIRYNPYVVDLSLDGMRASSVLRSPRNWCVPKATLFVACCRALGIPARPGYADVRNHLSSPRLTELMGTHIFVWHGYTEVLVDDVRCKASPAFDSLLCERFGVPPLEFDGREDALLHAFDGSGRRHMEYINDHGTYQEVPIARITRALSQAYPSMAGILRAPDAAHAVDEEKARSTDPVWDHTGLGRGADGDAR